jgi:hypothetical protein
MISQELGTIFRPIIQFIDSTRRHFQKWRKLPPLFDELPELEEDAISKSYKSEQAPESWFKKVQSAVVSNLFILPCYLLKCVKSL